MTVAPEVKGWCPGALRPMLSGDGLLVRLRPPGGRLTPVQAAAIARAAFRHGNGFIDLTARANLQLRGVTETSHPTLIRDLRHEGLIDADIATESLRNLIVTPFREGPPTNCAASGAERGATNDPTDTLAATLTAALARMPRLPAKFGFALDTGPRPALTGASADIRVERARDGRLILRPDGHPTGKPVADLAADAIAMAEWFLASGGVTDGRGRMAALIARGIVPDGHDTAPADALPTPTPGLTPHGALVAPALGQLRAETLAALGHEIRLTPWRMLLIVGATRLPDIPGLITDAADPLLAVTACTGAPGCPQGRGDTRSLARSLAPHLPQARTLHVSGCPKGCAHPAPAAVTIVATPGGYDLIRDGSASDAPSLRSLAAAAVHAHLKAPDAPRL